MGRPSRLLSLFAGLLLTPMTSPLSHASDGVVTAIQEGSDRLKEAQQAQENINEIDDQTQTLVEEHRQLLRSVADLRLYNDLLAGKLDNQQQEVAKLERSINGAAKIERQVLPLLNRMIATLSRFIQLDLPFLMKERTERIARLRSMLERSDVSVAEKVRRVFEAYQVEGQYGRSIEAYTANLIVGEATFDAEILRVGRIALVYRGLGSKRTGYWDAEAGSWEADDGVVFRRHVEQGLKVARRDVAPELLTVPVFIDGRGD